MASSAESPHRGRPTLHVQMPSYSDVSPSCESGPDEKRPNTMDHDHLAPDSTMALSPIETREAANRMNDDLELLRAERIVSHQAHESASTRVRNRSHDERVEDAFNTTTPVTDTPNVQGQKSTWLTRFWNSLKKFPRVLRYILYAIPPGILILIPVFLDLFAYAGRGEPVGGEGGVQLLWFGIWLEVVWLSLWAVRIFTSVIPATTAFIADTVGSSNHKKWKDIGRQLEFPTALFLWMLTVLVSYRPILDNHRVINNPENDGTVPPMQWIDILDKVITALFVLATLNLTEKILIQWIATSFHLRTYSHRIRDNQMQIECLVALYTYAKTRLEAKDPVWDSSGSRKDSSGSRTPMKTIQTNARQALSKVGNAASRMAGDFTGRKILKTNHPRKVVMELLRTTSSSYTLARVFYRTFVQPEKNTITVEDLQPAFQTQEDAEACFGVFDHDLNGDISMEELEMVCNEIHLEKKAIAASLKDLDSVIKKLDEVFMFIIVVIVIIVFISIISNSAAAALTSTGTVILGLSWLLQATAQEFLQSIIFVFVKHPFDVGDRVTIYGNTGSKMTGDDYYVIEVSLLYTEFKKMEGHVVQAPNSILNTLFILNQRRSQGLADPINLKLRFGVSEAQIEELKARMLDFCLQNKRDYAPRIISEVQTIDEVMSITMNIIFFHKSNYQNELLRLTRHNRFAVELMKQMHDMGLETPRLVQPGGGRDMPMYWTQVQPPPMYTHHNNNSNVDNSKEDSHSEKFPNISTSSPAPQRTRGNSRAAVVEAGMDFQDVYHSRKRDNSISRLPSITQSPREDEDEEMAAAAATGRHLGAEDNMEKTGRDSESIRHRMFGPTRALSRRSFQQHGRQRTSGSDNV
ncbi:Mechanosensitive ion channel-domain-containing protein [Podospora australis]|uniref:Mechanosensitive ion channel protein n=1 Tax=Podospora australis TaxID=1536484 RepID=A0AAN6WZ77_9PEZI|nr:Mechanosensitive ion channel-domain-containing protein [Podospora australis]